MKKQKKSSILAKKPLTIGRIAAIWWAREWLNPKFDYGSKPIADSAVISLAKFLSRSVKKDSSAIILFVDILSSRIDEQLINASRFSSIHLSVYKTPESFLHKCALEAGLGVSIIDWSWNTTMIIKYDKIVIKHGSSSEEQVIWEA